MHTDLEHIFSYHSTQTNQNYTSINLNVLLNQTDTELERNYLIEKAVPPLQEYARSRGMDFQMAEMRWGVTQNNANNHEHAELCLLELRKCQEGSDGINFVVRYNAGSISL